MLRNLLRYTLVIAVIYILYTGGWFYFSNMLQKDIAYAIETLRSRGYEVEYTSIEFSGYPFSYIVEISDLDINRTDLIHTWIDGKMTFKAALWNPLKIKNVEGVMHHAVIFPDTPSEMTIDGEGFKFILFTHADPKFEFIYDQLRIESNDVLVLETEKLNVMFERESEDTARTPSMRFAGKVELLNIPVLKENPVSDKIENIDIKALLTGRFSGETLKENLQSWYKNGGTLDLAELIIKWGDIQLKAEGTASLDDSLQPIAAFSADITGVDKVLDAMVKSEYITSELAGLAKLSFSFLATNNENTTKNSSHRISITIQDGKLSLGPISMIEVPKIEW